MRKVCNALWYMLTTKEKSANKSLTQDAIVKQCSSLFKKYGF